MTKICRRNIFFDKKSKLQENPPVNRRAFHIMKFDPESGSGSSKPTESGFDPFTDQKINLQEEEKAKY
jgi:hypothetical protein